MSIELIRELQAYGYFVFLMAMVLILYSYWFHLNGSQKSGRRDYEKYSKLVLDDGISDDVLEDVCEQKDSGGVKK